MPTLLLVEDDDVDREAVRRCLADQEELEVVEAVDGEAARTFLQEGGEPDMIVTDLRMPRLDGLELVRWIHAEHPGIPVVLMTSVGNERIAVEALRAGAVNYVPKRDLAELLPDTVAEVMEMAAARRGQEEMLRHHRRTHIDFRLPSDPDLIWPLTQYVIETLERYRFGDGTVRSQVRTAVHEALANAMIHGNLEIDTTVRREDPETYARLLRERPRESPWGDRETRCTVELEPGLLECRVADEGRGFDVDSLPDPTRDSNLLEAGGRGVFLMRTLMDEVRYNDPGNEVTLSKRYPPSRD